MLGADWAQTAVLGAGGDELEFLDFGGTARGGGGAPLATLAQQVGSGPAAHMAHGSSRWLWHMAHGGSKAEVQQALGLRAAMGFP